MSCPCGFCEWNLSSLEEESMTSVAEPFLQKRIAVTSMTGWERKCDF